MERQAVSSSNIEAIGYDPGTQTLEIEFKSGGIYQYFNVPETEYQTFMAASSHGKYFHRHIRGTYRYVKI